MLKILAILAVLFAVTHAFLPASGQASNSSAQASGNVQKQGGDKHRTPQPSAAPIDKNQPPPAQWNTPSPSNQNAGNTVIISKSSPMPKGRDWPDWILWGAQCVLAGIAMYGIRLAYRTLKSTEVQAAAALAQANHITASERAWILITKIGDPPYLYSSESPQFVPGIVFNFQVCGKTPAKLTDGNFRILIVPRKGVSIPPIPDLPDVPDYSGPVFPEFFAEVGTVLPVGEPISVSVYYKSSLTQTQFDDMKAYKIFFCAYGFLEYEDVFGKKARTHVGYVYDFALGGVFKSPDGTDLNPPGFRKGGPRSYNQTT